MDALNTPNWARLAEQVKACTACPLHQTRKNTVLGKGDQEAPLLIVGEAPGAEEDKQGLPFVGAAGQLLDKMLAAVNLTPDDVYIANTLKCRPPQNRDPEPSEMACCRPFLTQQITWIKPSLIVALGRIAVQSLLNTSRPLKYLRNHLFTYGEDKIPLIVSFHPAYLLRSPAEKRPAWEDWKKIRHYLETAEYLPSPSPLR
jgi:uracil-DNA glycosylase family 4